MTPPFATPGPRAALRQHARRGGAGSRRVATAASPRLAPGAGRRLQPQQAQLRPSTAASAPQPPHRRQQQPTQTQQQLQQQERRVGVVAAASSRGGVGSGGDGSSMTVPSGASGRKSKAAGNPVSSFMQKVALAWRIFFPEEDGGATPKEEVKKRLRMVLVADRCGMNPSSLSEMKKHVVKALQDFVDIEGSEDQIEVAITSDPEMGTVYSVNIPIRRVKPEARYGGDGSLPEGQVADGITLEWDPKDPSSRFPMGC